jgi:hypothetical protein
VEIGGEIAENQKEMFWLDTMFLSEILNIF